MKALETAVHEREKQLKRQINTQSNPMIKEILRTEIAELTQQWIDAGHAIKQLPTGKK